MSSKTDSVQCGNRGAEFGKLGGRPRNSDQYGMSDSEYNDITAFLNSPQSAPKYPARMFGGSSEAIVSGKKRKRSCNKNKQKENSL